MKIVDCYRIGTLTSRELGQRSEADRLHIEEHRASCARCRANRTFDESLRDLVLEVPPTRPVAIEGIIASAFAGPSAEPAKSSTRQWGLVGLGLVGAAAAALAIALVVFGGRDGGRDGDSTRPVVTKDSSERLMVPAEFATGAAGVFGHSTVTARSPATVKWVESSRRLVLSRGALRVSVTPNTGYSFTVATENFDVHVLGTVFDVDASRVSVKRGAVKIVGKDGTVLRERVAAGESWSTATSSADELEDVDEAASEAGDVEDQVEEPATKPTRLSAAEYLARATRQLRQQELTRARASIRLALAERPSRRQRAEAGTLMAELALVNGNIDQAIKEYRRVAGRGRGSYAESALFAAARLEAKQGRGEKARKLLRTYQARYPTGRFKREVARKLKAMGETP